MIEVKWPLDLPQGDNEICDWLGDLVKQYPGECVFEYKSGLGSVDQCKLCFTREEDAIAFKLKFGI